MSHYSISRILYVEQPFKATNFEEVELSQDHRETYVKYIDNFIGLLVTAHIHNPNLFRDNTLSCVTIRMDGCDVHGNKDPNILLYVTLK
jgi:hypothetical protein